MKISTFFKYTIVAGIISCYYSCNSNSQQANKSDAPTAKEEASGSVIDLDKNYSYKNYEIIPYQQYSNKEAIPFNIGDNLVALFIIEESYGSLIETKVLSVKDKTDEITGEPIAEPIFEGNEGNNYIYDYLFKGLKQYSQAAIDCYQFYNSDEWYAEYKINIDYNQKMHYNLKLDNVSNNKSLLILSSEGKSKILLELPIGAKPDGKAYPQLFNDIDGDDKPDLIMYYYTESTNQVIEHTLLFLSSEADENSFLKLVSIYVTKKEKK